MCISIEYPFLSVCCGVGSDPFIKGAPGSVCNVAEVKVMRVVRAVQGCLLCVSTFLNTIIDMSNTIANAFTKSITARCADSLLWAVGDSEKQITWLP